MRGPRFRLICKPALWCFATIAASALLTFLVNAVGMMSLGGVRQWAHWFQDHRLYFLLWRILIYGITVYAWLAMRRRVLTAEPDGATAMRLLRAEVSAIVAVVLIEGVQLFQSP